MPAPDKAVPSIVETSTVKLSCTALSNVSVNVAVPPATFSATFTSAIVTADVSSFWTVSVAVSVIVILERLTLPRLKVSVSSASSFVSPPSGMLIVWVSPAVPVKLTLSVPAV